MQKKVKFLLLKKSTTNISLKEAIKKMVKKEGKVFFVVVPPVRIFISRH